MNIFPSVPDEWVPRQFSVAILVYVAIVHKPRHALKQIEAQQEQTEYSWLYLTFWKYVGHFKALIRSSCFHSFIWEVIAFSRTFKYTLALSKSFSISKSVLVAGVYLEAHGPLNRNHRKFPSPRLLLKRTDWLNRGNSPFCPSSVGALFPLTTQARLSGSKQT